jgi:hypothetical protein
MAGMQLSLNAKRLAEGGKQKEKNPIASRPLLLASILIEIGDVVEHVELCVEKNIQIRFNN